MNLFYFKVSILYRRNLGCYISTNNNLLAYFEGVETLSDCISSCYSGLDNYALISEE